ncbi:Uncharacterised protein [Starkeya nomas]|uniref:Uncharacterized protein n=1 Tax=Starkeya nomas TaxID=2666134 RepID=A0A5S9P1D9_9HYPH|nr:hypothetical protein [Starkeya nomas]CAA0096909.1 Uncharacterised protein [Starkeya nomas]
MIAPETQGPAAVAATGGAKAKAQKAQKARRLGKSDLRKSKRNAPVSQVFLIGVYGGRERIGSIRQDGEYVFVAMDLDGVSLGRFRTLRAASRAIPGPGEVEIEGAYSPSLTAFRRGHYERFGEKWARTTIPEAGGQT